jgi:transposase
MNWFRARGEISAGAVEGLNNKAKLTTRKAYGFRGYDVLKHIIALMSPSQICGEGA